MSDRFTYTRRSEGHLAAVRTFNPVLDHDIVTLRLYAADADISEVPDADGKRQFDSAEYRTIQWAQLQLTASDARQLAADLLQSAEDAEVDAS